MNPVRRVSGSNQRVIQLRYFAVMKRIFLFLFTCLAVFALSVSAAEAKKILLLAGKQSHGPGDHEFQAGCLLLKQCLDEVPGVDVKVYSNGWPSDESAFEGADAVLIYADGGAGHPAVQGGRIQLLNSLVKKGVGIGCAHYGVEVLKGEAGDAMFDWIGGHYEHQYSVNPMWSPKFESFPNHPVTRGVKPFALIDEWYFNMRWRPDSKGVTPILVATPTDDVRDGPYVYPNGPYPHIVAASGRPETMMWVYDRSDGGRGFGFTGGHKHVNWANDNFRKVVLNGILWMAHVEVPKNGVDSVIGDEVIVQNLDPKKGASELPNLTGNWTFQVETDQGGGSPTFRLVHAGQNLLGRYNGLFGQHDVFGSVRGNSVTLNLEVSVEEQRMAVTYTGTLDAGGKMKGKVQFGELGEGTWSASR